MSCQENHQSKTTQFCPVCGIQLKDEFVEKFNKELLPELVKTNGYHSNHWFNDYNGEAKRINMIYQFIIDNKLKVPRELYFDAKSGRFMTEADLNEAYPEYKIYSKKYAKMNTFGNLLGIKWIFFINHNTMNFNNIKKLEKSYETPLPDGIYTDYLDSMIDRVEDVISASGDKKPVAKEYLKTIIDKM